MYTSKDLFKPPQNEDDKVWRYMDFTKFVSLLQTRKLFFSRADKFNDPFEGSWPKDDVLRRYVDAFKRGQPDDFATALSTFVAAMRTYAAINCWHKNEHESAAMWNLYVQGGEGIAIQSTFRRLRDSITDPIEVYLGVVQYIDYSTTQIGSDDLLSAFMHKRRSFEHEQEVRALIFREPIVEGKARNEPFGDGVSINVNIDQLIEKVCVAPSSPQWFADVVVNLVNQYDYNLPIVRSKMDERPIY